MLGQVIHDPDNVESAVEKVPGLGFLPAETIFDKDKATYRSYATITGAQGWLADVSNQTVSGYEIHMGRTRRGASWLNINRREAQQISVADGAISDDGRIWGCYLHGLFANQNLRRAWLSSLGWRHDEVQSAVTTSGHEAAFDRLADAIERSVNIDRLDSIILGSQTAGV